MRCAIGLRTLWLAHALRETLDGRAWAARQPGLDRLAREFGEIYECVSGIAR